MTAQPPLQIVSPDATPEEVAAITAAVAAVLAERRAAASASGELHEWVRASRLSARRTGLMRGPWRLSGRIGRRSRA